MCDEFQIAVYLVHERNARVDCPIVDVEVETTFVVPVIDRRAENGGWRSCFGELGDTHLSLRRVDVVEIG